MSKHLDHWQRLSPLSVIFFIGKFLVRLIKDGLSTFAPLLIIILASSNKLIMMAVLGAGLLTLMLGGSVLQFWFFKFRQHDDQILINDGVFQKNHRVIRFERVQNINLLSPIYFRPFGLVTLQVETAGSKDNEADLAGIPIATAEQLRRQILDYQQSSRGKHATETATVENHENSTIVASASLRDLLAYGVSSNSVFLFLAILGPVVGAFFNSFEDATEEMIKQNIIPIINSHGGGFPGNFMLGLVLLAGLIALMFLFSILGSIYRYYGYQLSRKQQTLKRQSGLLTRFEESLKLVKVQTFVTQSNIIGRWIKRQNVILGQVVSAQNGTQGKRNIFIIPARTAEQIPALKSLVFADAPTDIAENKIDRRYIIKTWLLWFLLPLVLPSIPLSMKIGFWFFAVPILSSLIILPLVIKHWSMFRYGFTRTFGIYQSGLFGFKRTLFPLYKVQHTVIKQSPLQRRRKLATLKIHLAAGSIVIPYIPMQLAKQYVETIRTATEVNKSPWY
ncbi:MAG: PH domain-containing protein [Proteobacteria bacterium]|nr:PH domain-containing protein [Pseudomonadota bacterium]